MAFQKAVVDRLQVAFKPVKDLADKSGTVWVKAERRLGQELRKIDNAKGGEQYHRRPSTSAKSAPVPTRKDLGLPGDVGKKRSAKAAKLADLGERKLDQTITALIADGKPVNPNTVLAQLRTEATPSRRPWNPLQL